jgi:aminoglycoside phosphotransferase (APT) family kinase protein
MSAGDFSGTMPVSDHQRVEPGSLGRWLQDHLPGFDGLLRIEQFRGGQSNPTYLLTAESGAQYVLRKKPAGALLPSAHAVDREFRVISGSRAWHHPSARHSMTR